MRGGVVVMGERGELECVTIAGISFNPLGRSRHADPLWGKEQDVLGCLDSVLHEHRHSHGSHTSRDRGDEARLLSHAWK